MKKKFKTGDVVISRLTQTVVRVINPDISNTAFSGTTLASGTPPILVKTEHYQVGAIHNNWSKSAFDVIQDYETLSLYNTYIKEITVDLTDV